MVFSKSKHPPSLPFHSLSTHSLWLGPPPIPHSLQLLTSRHACVNAPCFDREFFFHLDHNGIIRLREIPCLRGFLDLIWRGEKCPTSFLSLNIISYNEKNETTHFNCSARERLSECVSCHIQKLMPFSLGFLSFVVGSNGKWCSDLSQKQSEETAVNFYCGAFIRQVIHHLCSVLILILTVCASKQPSTTGESAFIQHVYYI